MTNWRLVPAGAFIGGALMMARVRRLRLPGSQIRRRITVFFGAGSVSTSDGAGLLGALIIGAVYMLRAVRTILHGPLPEKWANLADCAALLAKAPFIICSPP